LEDFLRNPIRNTDYRYDSSLMSQCQKDTRQLQPWNALLQTSFDSTSRPMNNTPVRSAFPPSVSLWMRTAILLFLSVGSAIFLVNTSRHTGDVLAVEAFSIGVNPSCRMTKTACHGFSSRLIVKSTTETSPSVISLDEEIDNAVSILERAADTKSEESDVVYDALVLLEQKMRLKAKEDGSVAPTMLKSLDGDWRLIFTTGTKKTQQSFLGGNRINYFPLKAVQTFRTDGSDPMRITNSIYFADTDFSLIKFIGLMEFELKKRRLSFDFDKLELFNGLFTLNLSPGQAREMGSTTGLGSKGQTNTADGESEDKDGSKMPPKAQRQAAFFNWISANDKIATARGGGGGLALWKRVA
jgi:hypothetical protein